MKTYRPIDDFKSLQCPLYQGNQCLMEKCPAWEVPHPLEDQVRRKDEKPIMFPDYDDRFPLRWEIVGEEDAPEDAREPVKNWRGKVVRYQYIYTGKTVPGVRWRAYHTMARCRVLMPTEPGA